MTRTPTYVAWFNMHQRCENAARDDYARYGGRGIKVCERWSVFDNFLADMGPRPSADHSIEREDNDGPYAPDNCIWATRIEQARNKRSNRLLTFNGRIATIAEWCEITGLSRSAIACRLRRGWPVELVLSSPLLVNQYR